MCVSSAAAVFTGTKGYIGSVTHPKHGFVHVLGYQNEVSSLYAGPNSMILPLPTHEEMGPDNMLDMTEYAWLLDRMIGAFTPATKSRSLGLTNSASKSYVKVFEKGAYHVVLASHSSLVEGALKQVPESKRPRISAELLAWYGENYPEHAIAICCFSNRSLVKAEPLFWWYKPKSKDAPLFFPAVDSHSGGLPDLGAAVWVDHNIIVGYDEPQPGRLTATIANAWKGTMPSHIADFLSPHIGKFAFNGQMYNGDFVKSPGEVSLNRVRLTPFWCANSPQDLLARGLAEARAGKLTDFNPLLEGLDD